ncbi:putative Serine carboxypeptidase [Zostera marina]|uniref:Carboxypeptidase n=1 Tax=Zostera marina TaxID=29655 RepID=A0A0K9PJM7_ZOSMR|nr:putative Serine carboxypeptidase [Zostera marina]
MASNLFAVFFLFISASVIADALLLPPTVKLPNPRAEEVIRRFNLIPQDARPELIGDGDESGERIVERRIRFPGLDSTGNGANLEDLAQHAGYYKIANSYAAKMFYFFFESRGSKEDPIVIWLTGGPGCSSELAVFFENGPFTIADNMSLIWNDYGWDKVSNLIYVDQPTGTGFSYSSDERDLRHDETGVSNDLYDFMQTFFAKHPEYVNHDFYITGESYAGHYIPAFASRVYQGNKMNEGIHINLKGFAIGNGLTDPAIQYKAYTDYALQMGIITESEYKKINLILPTCELAIKICGTSGTTSCLASYLVCNTIFSSIMKIAGNINYYDIRKECVGSLCYDFSNMEKFLNLKSVRNALGVGNINFVSCSPTVYQAMLTDWMRDLEVGIPDLVNNGVKLLVYAGEYDLICNWLGNSRWVESMEWNGQKNYVSADILPFMVDGVEAGQMKNYDTVSFLKVHNAGHMVPMDQPKASLEMLKRWIGGNLSEPSLALPLESVESVKSVLTA